MPRVTPGTNVSGAFKVRGGPFQILGLDEINKKLAKLEAAIGKKIIRKEIRKALKPVKDRVKALTPVGETGQIKRAIKVMAGRSKKGSITYRVVIGKQNFHGKSFYGAFAEFGTKRQKAQHFMKRGFDQTAQKAKADAEAGILAACLLELA